MNILLVGERYSQNLGDPIICRTVENLIKEHFGERVDITFVDLTGKTGYDEFYNFCNPGSVITFGKILCRTPLLLKSCSGFYDIRKTLVRHIRSLSLFEKILQEKVFDLIVFAGGEMFLGYFIDLIYYVVKEASNKKIPVVFHACGISDLSKRSIRLLKKVFLSDCVRSVSIRDSKERFDSLFDKSVAVKKTNDTALCCSKYFMAKSGKIADIGVGLIDLPQYKDVQKQMVKFMIDSQLSWKLFTNGSPYDQTFAEQILTELNVAPINFSEYLCDRSATPEELVKTITGFNRIVSFRLHSQVIASSFSIDSYAVIWDEKVKDFYQSIGFPQRCFYPSEIVEAMPSIIHDKKSDVLATNVLSCAKDSECDLVNQISEVLEER